jgi:hypothetical protein
MDLVDLEFLELGCLAGKNWSGAVFVDLELRGALPKNSGNRTPTRSRLPLSPHLFLNVKKETSTTGQSHPLFLPYALGQTVHIHGKNTETTSRPTSNQSSSNYFLLFHPLIDHHQFTRKSWPSHGRRSVVL